MYRTNLIRPIAIAAFVALTASGCGAIVEKATEKAVEEATERAVEAETGEDVEIDFSDGELTIESSEGDISINVDDNGVQIEGTDAEGNDFSLDADEDGVQAESEGGESLDIDGDGTFTVTDEDGDVTTGEFDEDDGSFVVEGEDGSVFSSGEGVPSEWPSDVPVPSGLSEVFGTYSKNGEFESSTIGGVTSQSASDGFDSYVAELTSAGFEETSLSRSGDALTGIYARGDLSVAVSFFGGDGDTDVTVSASIT